MAEGDGMGVGGDKVPPRTSRRYAVAAVLLGAVLLVSKLSGRSVAAGSASQDYSSMAQREMLMGGHSSPSVQQRMATLKQAGQELKGGGGGSHSHAHSSTAGDTAKAVSDETPVEVGMAKAVSTGTSGAVGKGKAVSASPKGGGGKQTLAANGTSGKNGGVTGVPKPGWDKSGWTHGDWSFWLLTGPVVTIAFSFFMFYTYGLPGGLLTFIVCAVIDICTYYYNL